MISPQVLAHNIESCIIWRIQW